MLLHVDYFGGHLQTDIDECTNVKSSIDNCFTIVSNLMIEHSTSEVKVTSKNHGIKPSLGHWDFNQFLSPLHIF